MGGKGVCRRLMSPAQETQSMQEIPAQRGRVNRYAILVIPEFRSCSWLYPMYIHNAGLSLGGVLVYERTIIPLNNKLTTWFFIKSTPCWEWVAGKKCAKSQKTYCYVCTSDKEHAVHRYSRMFLPLTIIYHSRWHLRLEDWTVTPVLPVLQ
jgi:hypothetical protein